MLFFVALLAIFVWIVLMVELYKVYRNFGKGLKERGKVCYWFSHGLSHNICQFYPANAEGQI